MQRIKQQVDQLQQQLAGLTPGQKLLTGALVAVMLATVVWWVHYATTDRAVALFDRPVSAEVAGAVRDALALRGIPCEVLGGDVFVAVEQAEAAILLLEEERLLPSQAAVDHYANAFAQSNIFESGREQDRRAENALRLTLGDALVRTVEGVRSAEVFLDLRNERRLGGEIRPSASVLIATAADEDVRRVAESAAQIVRGAVAGMSLKDVSVVVNGKAIAVGEDESGPMALQAQAERSYAENIRRVLPSIPNLAISVGVEMAGGSELASADRESTSDIASAIPAGLDQIEELLSGETDVYPNQGRRIEEPLLPAAENADVAGAVVSSPQPRVAACAMNIPLSWILGEWQARNGADSFPDPDVLQRYETAKLEEIRQLASAALGGLPPELIRVTVDADVSLAGAPIPMDDEEAGISTLIRDYGSFAAVAALAAVGVLLATTMLKKTVPLAGGAVSVLEETSFGLEALGEEFAGAEHLAADAGAVFDEVHQLVRQNPDEAAALVQQWLAAA